MNLKSFFKNYIIAIYLIIIICFTGYLFWQNLELKKEISSFKNIKERISNLQDQLKYLRVDVSLLRDTLELPLDRRKFWDLHNSTHGYSY